MFGYIKPHSPELKVREDAYYRGVYCGLCRAMGHCTGCMSRLTLSYDFVYLALIRIAATGEAIAFRPRRCAAHPLTRRAVAEENDALRYCARTAAMLGALKNRDDLADERGMRRLRARLADPLLTAMQRRALQDDAALSPLADEIADALSELQSIETEHTPSIDQPADCFGRLMRALASHGLSPTSARIAGELGHHLGRWIYVIDALDDYADDCRLGRYNPIAAARGGDPLDDAVRRTYADALTAELMQIEAALDLLDLEGNPDNAGLLRNILYLGMPRTARRVLFGEENGTQQLTKNGEYHD
ncbi:MAG: hypothetical protein IJF49_04615 [Clostridia bacterium]|nr:hypothetical protein [Clostridia bacterium]